jgi:DNA-directed RNA polymerase specialized sigma24 family protein
VHFEHERQEWLELGMSEADIYRIHFGEPCENGRGGDYRVWLDERRHVRCDHKYAHGTPISYERLPHDDRLLVSNTECFDEINISVDLCYALSVLTDLQRKYFALVIVSGYSYAEVARKHGITEGAVRKHIRLALPKLKNFF